MVCCFVPGCSHKSNVHGCKMFRFPCQTSSPMRRLKWKKLLRRKDCSPKTSSRVCSCHFADGMSKNLPQLDLKNSKRMLFTSPEKTKRSKRCTLTEASTQSNRNVGKNIVDTESVTHDQEVDSMTIETSPMGSEEAERVQEKENSVLESCSKSGLVLLQEELKEARAQNLILPCENYFLKKELEESKKKKQFNVSMIAKNISHFTGLPSIQVFDLVLSLLDDVSISYYFNWNVECLSKSDQLLMTLMKLRRNLSNTDLASRFDVSESTVSNVVITFIFVLYKVLVKGLMDTIPSRQKNQSYMPRVFSDYSSCRIILDCTKVYTAVPKKMSTQTAMYSDYKHRITLKGLVGIAPNGTVIFVSELFPGSTSDKVIVQNSGILDKLVAGDFVMADKGFLIGDILPPGVTLNIPPFKTTPQFTPAQVQSTLRIAQSRIHVERAIRNGKIFKILDYIPGKYVPFASTIFGVCFALTNFRRPLIKEIKNSMQVYFFCCARFSSVVLVFTELI